MRRFACALVIAFACATGTAAARICSITGGTISFGNYDVYSSSLVSTSGTISYSCNGNGTITISLDTGAHASSYANRYLSNGTDLLAYNIYDTVAHSTVWGDGTAGTFLYSNSATSASPTLYGLISPAGQDVSAGSYSDSVTATINF